MKKTIFSSALFMSGLISASTLLAGTMANNANINGQVSALRNLSDYGLLPLLYLFFGIAVLGMGFALMGLFQKDNH